MEDTQKENNNIYEYSRWNSSNITDSTLIDDEFNNNHDDVGDEEDCQEVEVLIQKRNHRTSTKNSRRQHINQQPPLSSIWHKQCLPDGPWKICNVQILDFPSVKLFKFFLISILLMAIVHYYAIVMDAKRDETYTIKEMVLYDGNHIILDILVFFLVGRLYRQTSVDNLAWTIPALFLAIFVSMLASNAQGIDHSITPHEIRCNWGWQMWTFVGLFGIPLAVGLTSIHFIHACRNGFGVQKLIELSISLLLFIAPYAKSSFFHLHHWYYAWVLGMHANADIWWSRLTMSLLWGLYINGVAIFGRDPIMTCAVTLYQSQNQQCPYLVEENFTFESLIASVDHPSNGCGDV